MSPQFLDTWQPGDIICLVFAAAVIVGLFVAGMTRRR